LIVKLLSGTSTLPIGVDIGGRHMRAVQLQGAPGRWTISAAGSVMRDNPGGPLDPTDAAKLRHMIENKSFKGKRVVLAVPPDQLLTGIMELPPRGSGAPLDQLARSELSRMHRCEPDSFEIACWDLPAPARAGGATYVMAAGFGHQQANEFVDTIESEGLDVFALDVNASAVARACGPLLSGVEGIAAILDLRWGQATLVLLYQGVVVYERKLVKCSIQTVVESLIKDLKLHRERAEDLVRQVGLATECSDIGDKTLAEVNRAVGAYGDSLVKEMRIPLSYLTNQYPDAAPETLLLVGGGARIPGLLERLDSVLEFYVQTVRSGDIAGCSPEIERTFGSSLASAAGLGQFSENRK